MSFSLKSDLFFRFEKVGRSEKVTGRALPPFHAGGPHRDAASAPAQAHSRSSRPGEALDVEPAQGRREDRRLGRRFRERKTSNHRARVGLCSQSCSAPRRRRPGRCEVRPAPATFLPTAGRERDHAGRVFEFSHPPSIHARATDATRASVAGMSRLFSRRGEPRASLTFLNPRLHPRRANVGANLASAPPPVSYRRAGVGRRRLPRRRCPLPRRRPGARAAGARTPRRARGPRQPHAHSARRRRGVHARVPGARRAQGQGHRPEDEARELSVDAKFSFVLIDKVNGRVFAASTALSSPLALGHATDGAFQRPTAARSHGFRVET